MSAQSSDATFDEYVNEQLIDCLYRQTNVIKNLEQYSQCISLQLFDIKNHVNMLTNRVLTLQEQQNFAPPPINPWLFFQPSPQQIPSVPFSFSSKQNEELPSRHAPFIFGPITPVQLDDNDDDESEPDINYTPIITLQPVKIQTGEEDEEILFCERAKLYRFDSTINQMKERGTGEIKILKHLITNSCRILMRREQIFKICANHKLTVHMELKPHQGTNNAYVWSAIDFADGEAKHETLCVKFKTNEQAKKFEQIFNQSKTKINTNLPSIENISLNDNDVILVGEIRPTIEQIERARRLQLPLTFYLYELKQPCKGCRGCRDDVSSMVPIQSPPRDHRMIIKAKRALPVNRPPPTVISDYIPPPIELNRIDESTKAQQKKSRNVPVPPPSVPIRSLEDYSSEIVDTILDQVKQELETENKNQSKAFPFTNFDTITKPPSNFHFTDSKTVTFGSDENVIFCEQAQFLPDNLSGELKILKNRTTNSSRILMNHDEIISITSELNIRIHETIENAYTWSLIDDEKQQKIFIVKFQTSDIAKQFFQQIHI